MAGSLSSRRRSRWPIAAVVVVLCVHAVGTALSGSRFGPPFVLALSSALAAWLWAVVRVGRRGSLPAGVRWALLAVWLIPPLLLWLAAGWAALFPSPRDPQNGPINEGGSNGSWAAHFPSPRNPAEPVPSPWCCEEAEPAAAPDLGTQVVSRSDRVVRGR